MFLFRFKCHYAFKHPQTHLKREAVYLLIKESKPFFFSVLIAFSQRNNYFCGCKGTKYNAFFQTIFKFFLNVEEKLRFFWRAGLFSHILFWWLRLFF